MSPRSESEPTLAEFSVESRILFAFSVSADSLARLLPPGWSICSPVQGPARGANLFLVVADRLLVHSGHGGSLENQSMNKLAVLAVPAESVGATGLLITAGFSAQSAAVPGPYRVFVPARISFARRLGSADQEHVEEEWKVDSRDGSTIRASLKFTRGIPVRTESTTWAFSALDPSLRRVYVADQGIDVLQSNGTASARLEAATVQAGGGCLQPLFDGLERLISITSLPWSMRRAFVPQPVRA